MGSPAKTFQIDGTLKPGPQFETSDGQLIDYNPYQIPIENCVGDRTQLYVIFLPPENGGTLLYLCGLPCPPKCVLNQLCVANLT